MPASTNRNLPSSLRRLQISLHRPSVSCPPSHSVLPKLPLSVISPVGPDDRIVEELVLEAEAFGQLGIVAVQHVRARQSGAIHVLLGFGRRSIGADGQHDDRLVLDRLIQRAEQFRRPLVADRAPGDIRQHDDCFALELVEPCAGSLPSDAIEAGDLTRGVGRPTCTRFGNLCRRLSSRQRHAGTKPASKPVVSWENPAVPLRVMSERAMRRCNPGRGLARRRPCRCSPPIPFTLLPHYRLVYGRARQQAAGLFYAADVDGRLCAPGLLPARTGESVLDLRALLERQLFQILAPGRRAIVPLFLQFGQLRPQPFRPRLPGRRTFSRTAGTIRSRGRAGPCFGGCGSAPPR